MGKQSKNENKRGFLRKTNQNGGFLGKIGFCMGKTEVFWELCSFFRKTIEFYFYIWYNFSVNGEMRFNFHFICNLTIFTALFNARKRQLFFVLFLKLDNSRGCTGAWGEPWLSDAQKNT